MSLEVIHPGLLTTVQDLGRYGFQKYGVIVSGAMDSLALRMANLLVGNEEGAAALELTLLGPTLIFHTDSLIAICGGQLSPSIDNVPIPNGQATMVTKGSILTFGIASIGCRAYLAVAGGIAVPPLMGSKSTYLRAHLGGFAGRALRKGDQLSINQPSELGQKYIDKLSHSGKRFQTTDFFLAQNVLPTYQKNPVIRFIPGSQYSLFTAESQKKFVNEVYQVTPNSDRMGYRLKGAPLQFIEATELISEAVSFGTVQIPPDGTPIILMADRQTTGGYAKIAQIATVDLPLVAQLKPGDQLHFQEIRLEEAEHLYFTREKQIQLVRAGLYLHQ